MLSDCLSEKIVPLSEESHTVKHNPRTSKTLTDSLFQLQTDLTLEDVLKKLNDYFLKKSPSFAQGELSHLLELKYSNDQNSTSIFKEK